MRQQGNAMRVPRWWFNHTINTLKPTRRHAGDKKFVNSSKTVAIEQQTPYE